MPYALSLTIGRVDDGWGKAPRELVLDRDSQVSLSLSHYALHVNTLSCKYLSVFIGATY